MKTHLLQAGTAWALAWILLVTPPGFAQNQAPTLLVNGTPVGGGHLITRFQREWVLPLAPVARALGASVEVEPGNLGLRVRRADGVDLSYDGRTGDIRNRLVHAGRIRDFEQYPIAANVDEIVLPASAIAALFEADIIEDSHRNLLRIETTNSSSGVRGPETPLFHLNEINYNYGLTANGRQTAQFVYSEYGAMLGETRLTGDLTVTQNEGRTRPSFAQGHARADFVSGMAAVIGDYGTGFGLDPLATVVRGAGLEGPLGKFRGHAYAGRSAGGTYATLGSSVGRARFDTWLGGFGLRRRDPHGEMAFGVNSFSGTDRKGTTVAATFGRINDINQFKVQGSAGRFEGLSARTFAISTDGTSFTEETRRVKVDGAGLGVSVVDSFTPVRQLSIIGEYDRYSRNFLTSRENSRFNGQDRRAGTLVLRPVSLVSLSGGVFRQRFLVGEDDRASGHNYGINVSAPGAIAIQAGYMRSVQKDTSSLFGRFEVTQYSLVAPRINRFSFFGYHSLTAFGSERSKTTNLLATMRIASRNRLVFRDQIQLGNSHRYGAEWIWESPESGVFLQAGLDRLVSRLESPDLLPVVGLRVPFARKHSLEVSYTGQRGNHLIQVQLKGAIVPERQVILERPGVRTVVVLSTLQGRVYLDADEDGTYTRYVDVPLSGIEILARTEGNIHKSITNTEGLYRIENLEPGAAGVKAEIGAVPADMVFADSTDRIASIVAYRDNTQNFRAVLTGRIIGRVTLRKPASESEPTGEHPVPDARIAASGERDAYSDSTGYFLLGDLAPGTYQIALDPESIPAGYVSEPPLIEVVVRAGKTREDVRFRLVVPPRPVIEK